MKKRKFQKTTSKKDKSRNEDVLDLWDLLLEASKLRVEFSKNMDILIDLSINLIAALVGFGIGWLWKEIRKKIKTRRARIFWKPFVSGELKVVIGRFSEFKAFERSGFIGIGSAMGLTELYSFFKKIGLRDFTVLYADRIEGNSLKTNLILLGGPDANSISREALSRIKSTIKLGDPDTHEILIRDGFEIPWEVLLMVV